MIISAAIRRLTIVAASLLVVITAATAADLKVYSTIAFQGALDEIGPRFEKATNNKLAITYELAAQLAQRIQAGEQADVLVLTRTGIDTLLKDEKIVHGSDMTLASSSMAIAVKAGRAKPDISTPDAFRRTLLEAKSIAAGDPALGGASSVYFARLMDRMGLTEQIKSKIRRPPVGKYPADLLIGGEAELGVMQTSEVIPGTVRVGVLPGDLNNVTVFAAGLSASTADAARANAFLKFLQSEQAIAVYKSKGLDPN